jgi:5-deoxy-glucuronate isomerase
MTHARAARHLVARDLARESDSALITPDSAGWRFTGLRVVDVAPGGERFFGASPFEFLVLPLSGSCVVVAGDKEFNLDGRQSVFHGPTDFLYLPIGTAFRIESRDGGSFALPFARAERKFSLAYTPAENVSVEIRGAGPSSRQLNNFFSPDFGEADKLVAVEVLTPGGNTSSYPPHKHDVAVPGGEAELEEIYYYRFRQPDAFGFHRTYAADGSFDVTATVRDGDVFLVPSGYHGPCSAMPGYDMYYLNVLAGPGSERSLAFSDDPAHAWIRPSWNSQERDSRVPMTPIASAER